MELNGELLLDHNIADVKLDELKKVEDSQRHKDLQDVECVFTAWAHKKKKKSKSIFIRVDLKN